MLFLNRLIASSLPYVPKSVVAQVSKRYIAGPTLEDAVRGVKDINAKGMRATLDLLGEDVQEQSEAIAIKDEWLNIIQSINNQRLDSNISVKLSQLGLRFDKEFCYRNLLALVEAAQRARNFVRIDMEDSSTTTETLELYRRLRESGFDNVGVVIQAYLRRSEEDVRSLAKLKTSFRLCKGIYIEPPEIGYQDRDEVRRNFVLLLRIMLEFGCYVGIATHDAYLIDKAYELLQKYRLQPHQYEFQMLLGVREQLREKILRDGHRLRVYIPYGEHWYAYSVRRLKENPQIAGYVLKALLFRNNE